MNDLLSLSELFSRNIFRIPDYQRGYSWSDLQLKEINLSSFNTTLVTTFYGMFYNNENLACLTIRISTSKQKGAFAYGKDDFNQFDSGGAADP